MIDKRTQYKLRKLTKELTKNKKGLYKKDKPLGEEKEKLQYTLDKLKSGTGGDGADQNTNAKAAKAIEKMLASGAYDKETVSLDEKKARELDKEIEVKVKQMVRDGKIKPAEEDAFIRKLRKAK